MPATSTCVIALLCAGIGFASSLRDDGIAAFHAGRYSTALVKLQQAAKDEPSDLTARAFLALAQAARNDCRSALVGIGALGDSPDDTIARLTGVAAAKCYQAIGDPAGAVLLIERLARRFPTDADVLYTLARFHMKAFNDATYAMFQRIPASYRVHQLSAEIFEVGGRYDEAMAEYRKAIALNPQAPNLHFRLGRAILMSAHGAEALSQARDEFAAELKLNPEDAACEFQLGQIAVVRNESDESRTHFERALSLAPDFPEALIALGRLHAQAQHYDRAIPLFERAVALQPSNEAGHYALMMAYRNTGQLEKAKAAKSTLDGLQKPPAGEFTEFLKKLGEKPKE